MAGIFKVLARNWGKKVKLAAGTWQEIEGIHAFTVAATSAAADMTDFDSAGYKEHLVANRGATITLEGYFEEDLSTGARAPGQERCEVLAHAVSQAGLGEFKLTSPGGTVWYFEGSCEVDGPSGNAAQATTWQCKVTVNGSITIV